VIPNWLLSTESRYSEDLNPYCLLQPSEWSRIVVYVRRSDLDSHSSFNKWTMWAWVVAASCLESSEKWGMELHCSMYAFFLNFTFLVTANRLNIWQPDTNALNGTSGNIPKVIWLDLSLQHLGNCLCLVHMHFYEVTVVLLPVVLLVVAINFW
jgi:hypothetical protein